MQITSLPSVHPCPLIMCPFFPPSVFIGEEGGGDSDGIYVLFLFPIGSYDGYRFFLFCIFEGYCALP